MKRYAMTVVSVPGILSCHGNDHSYVKFNLPKAASASLISKSRFKDLKFDNAKDLSRETPLSAGVDDTAYSKGRLYGFSSKEC
jgi:hypothetical protein